MKQTIIFLIVILINVVSTSAQTVVLVGKQAIDLEKNTPALSCTPIKITKSMKISKAEGNCSSFWIQKGSETIHRFSKFSDAVGTVLTPGTYYVYPNIKKGEQKADISLTLKSQNTS